MNNKLISEKCEEPTIFQEWESSHFGIRMAKVNTKDIFSLQSKSIVKAIKQSIEHAMDTKIRHLTLEIPESSAYLQSEITKLGFKPIDVRLKYTTSSMIGQRKIGHYKTREYRNSDYAKTIEIARASTFPSRFTNDLLLPRQKVKDLYMKWTEMLIEKKTDGGILIVGIKDHGIVGFGGLSPLKSDPSTLGNSLLACLPHGTGAGYSIIARGINDGLKKFSNVTFSTSSTNKKMIRLLEALDCTKERESHIYCLKTP